MDATIEVTGVRKRFGPAMALDGLSFTVTPGHVTGLAGPNGAGNPATELRHSLPAPSGLLVSGHLLGRANRLGRAASAGEIRDALLARPSRTAPVSLVRPSD